jgi:aspartyl-tRNA synthetase
LMTGSQTIREVIAFPKNQTAGCPLTAAPSTVEVRQLQELGIRVAPQSTNK